jgi:hypothetical protein
MSLETRVDTLEHDVALLKAEQRGWAEVAVAADRKASMSAELQNLVYREVLEMKTTQAEHGDILRGHTTTLDEHGDILRGHGDMLREHGEMLREILARLA